MLRTVIFSVIVCLLLTAGATASQARELPLVTGKHWIKSTEGEKAAYLMGMGTIIELEKEYQGEERCPESLNSKLVKGLSDHSIKEIKDYVDSYYAQNPGKLGEPVVRVIWYELIAPDLVENE